MAQDLSNLDGAMTTEPTHPGSTSLELPVDELIRRARPLPTHEEMTIDDLDDAEGAAFLDAPQG
jgi:hypothetical protein